MEIYNETAKTKSGPIKDNRPIGMVAIGLSDLDALSTETISIYIESSEKGSLRLATKQNLLSMCALAQHGEGGAFIEGGLMYFTIPVATGGALELKQNEELVIELENLKAAKTYAIETIDGGHTNGKPIFYDNSNFLLEKKSHVQNVEGFQYMAIRGVSSLSEMIVSLNTNGLSRKYSPVGIRVMEAEENDISFTKVDVDGAHVTVNRFTQDIAVINVEAYREIEFLKDAGVAVDFEFIKI